MTKQTRPIEKAPENKFENMQLNDLKAEVYDRASMIEQHNGQIQKLQNEIGVINQFIQKKLSR
jgi:hypothetical protein